MSGWVPLDADGWPFVAAALAKPWPVEAIRFDLRWWADRERMGLANRPGRPALVARWGITDKVARRMMADEATWGDPAQARVQRGSSRGPAKVQPRSSEGPAAATANADNGVEGSSRGPARVQPRSSEGPAEGPTRGVDTDTDTAQAPTPDETRASQPAAEEVECTHERATGRTAASGVALSAHTGGGGRSPADGASVYTGSIGSVTAASTAPASAARTTPASTTASTSAAGDATTAHPVAVSGRPPVAGSGDDAFAVAWATARMQRLDPTRMSLDRSDARAIERATRDGCTLADFEAIGAWLESPRAEWWQAKGYAVAGWRQLLGADGAKWRERLRDTQAREPARAGGKAAAVSGFFGELHSLEHEVIDVYVGRGDRGDGQTPQRRIGAS